LQSDTGEAAEAPVGSFRQNNSNYLREMSSNVT